MAQTALSFLQTVETSKTIEQVREALPAAALRHRFGLLAVHDLRQKMTEKGVSFERDCLVFEVCSPRQAKAVLEQDMRIASMLPCRIAVYREGGRTRLETVRPTALAEMYGEPGLLPTAREVEKDITAIMEESA